MRLLGDKNLISNVQCFKDRVPKIRFFFIAQIYEQLNALSEHRRLQKMVAMYIYTGLRCEEALRLTIDDVNLHASKHGMIRINAKAIDDESWQPKTKVNRMIPNSASLAHSLIRYTPRQSDYGWYFPGPEVKRWDPENCSAYLRPVNCNVGLKWNCLDFRHTFCSHLAQNGINLYKISTLFGKSPEICRRHYALIIPDSLCGDVDFLICNPNGVSTNAI